MTKDFQIIVTGASGFVAKNIRKYLSEHDIKQISISRKNFRKFKNETKIVSRDYDEKIILPKIKNSFGLIHLVGIGRQSVKNNYNLINVEFTRKIINLCNRGKIKKIVYFSGLGVSRTSSLDYFISKYQAENLIKESGLDYTIFRPSYIVGKDDLLTKHLKKQIKKGKITIPGSGNYCIQPIYINDVAQIVFKALKDKKFKNQTLDLVGSESIPYLKYVKLFSTPTKTKIKKLDLESAYYNAISKPRSEFGLDDLNLLIGNFKGDHKKLQNLSKLQFQSIRNLLKSRSFL